MKLQLTDVTLCAVDSVTPELSLQAISKSQKHCDFYEAILFTDHVIEGGNSCKIVPIKKLSSINDYSYFLLKKLGPFIKSKFVLIIQWDGYVLEPKVWTNEFLEYDYIGAKWEWFHDGMNVGNGGFSLRSTKLLNATSDSSFEYNEGVPEDVQICRQNYQHLISRNSIKFAPESVADKFSYERTQPNAPTFGFHGFFNMWRHCTDDEIINIINSLPSRNYQNREFTELMIQYFLIRKFTTLGPMYRKVKSVKTSEGFSQHVMQLTNNSEFSLYFTKLCESLL